MNKIPLTSQASFFKGLWFIFRDGDQEIAAHSSVLGKERIFLNGNLMSGKRSLGKSSRHQFIFEEIEYAVVYSIVKASAMNLECSLLKNSICIASFKAYHKQKSTVAKVVGTLLSGLLLGSSLGLLISYFHLPLVLSLILALVFYYIIIASRQAKRIIIDTIDV
jgi:hypothetical protein